MKSDMISLKEGYTSLMLFLIDTVWCFFFVALYYENKKEMQRSLDEINRQLIQSMLFSFQIELTVSFHDSL